MTFNDYIINYNCLLLNKFCATPHKVCLNIGYQYKTEIMTSSIKLHLVESKMFFSGHEYFIECYINI